MGSNTIRAGWLLQVCTQPRRVAATSVAERVAAERGEKCGESVGYAIRGETRLSRDKNSVTSTRLLFCTTGSLSRADLVPLSEQAQLCLTGVMLRQLAEDPLLSAVSHVFIDEVCYCHTSTCHTGVGGWVN